MSLITTLSLDSLTITDKRALVAELRASITADRERNKQFKLEVKQNKVALREAKKIERIAALQKKLDALLNPVGAKAIKANKKPSKAVVTKAA